MKFKIYTVLLLFLGMISCSSNEENCQCNQYFQSSNGSLVLYGGASMQFCDGTVPNPNPKNYVYKKECK